MAKEYIDVFNGDADGLCALVQLRLNNPQKSRLITGVKRDIQLLKKVKAQHGDHITVLDISHEKNAEYIPNILQSGASIHYIDHHKTGKLLKNPNITYDINLSNDVCTSLIVNKILDGKYRNWAIVGAFGDNLDDVARIMALESNLNDAEQTKIQTLGRLLNYNGYGSEIDDLFFDPQELYLKISQYNSPLEFWDSDQETILTLKDGYDDDSARALNSTEVFKSNTVLVVELPNEKWARRISGVFSNNLTNKYPNMANAVLVDKGDSTYQASIRAPLMHRFGADDVASYFPSGGGRKAASGINVLPSESVDTFIDKMSAVFGT